MSRFKRGLVLLLVFVLLAGVAPMSSFGDETDNEELNEWIEVKKTPEGKFGKNMTVSFIIHNVYDVPLEDVKIWFAPQEDYEVKDSYDEDENPDASDSDIYRHVFPFESTTTTFKKKSVGRISAGGKKGVSLSAKVRRDLKEGYYPVKIYVSYGDNNYIPPDVYIKVWVSASTGTSDETESNEDVMFVMGENQQTPYGIYPSVMNFNVNLRNSGIKKAYDVKVNMQLSEDKTKFPFEISESNYDRNMGDIDAGQTVEVPYSMAIRDDLKSGYYPITFKVKYREDMESDFVTPVDLVYYVRVKGNSEDELSADADASQRKKARLIVDSFETIPETVYAGQPFTLKVRMKNASADIPATNIVFTLASEEKDSSPVFSTESGANSIAVNSMGPGQTSDLSLDFISMPTVEQRYYTITIKEKYDSPEFKNAGDGDDVKISIPIKQEARLNTGTIEVMPDNINVGSETNVMFGVNNTGKVLLYNVMATFEGDTIQKTDAYVGNIKPGETGNVDAMLTGTAATMDDGKVKIIISYEDENGEVSTVEKEMMLVVSEPIPEDFDDMDAGNMEDVLPEDTSFFGKYKKFIFPAAAVAVVAVVVLIKVKKKKKAAKEAEEDMDDEIS